MRNNINFIFGPFGLFFDSCCSEKNTPESNFCSFTATKVPLAFCRILNSLRAWSQPWILSKLKTSYNLASLLRLIEVKIIQFELDPNLTEMRTVYKPDISKLRFLGKRRLKLDFGMVWWRWVTLLQDAEDREFDLPGLQIYDEPAACLPSQYIWMIKHFGEKGILYLNQDRLAACENQRNHHQKFEDKLALRSSATSWVLSMHVTIEAWKEISDVCHGSKYPHEPIVQAFFRPRFFYSEASGISVTQRRSWEWLRHLILWTKDLWSAIWFVFWCFGSFFSCNFLMLGGDEVNTHRSGEVGKSALETPTYFGSIGQWDASSQKVTLSFVHDMPLKNAELYGTIYNKESNQSEGG